MTHRQNPWAISPAPPYCPTRKAEDPYRPNDLRYLLVFINAGSVWSSGDVQWAMAYAIESARPVGRAKESCRKPRRGCVSLPKRKR